MKPVIFAIACLALSTSACTTVSISDGPAPSVISQTVSKARSAITKSAATLSYVFSKEKWSSEDVSSEKQSAASILLNGMKSPEASNDNVQDYISTVQDSNAVMRDITLAKQHVDTISAEAYAALNENPDMADVKVELTSLEKALISSRQAEMTFTRAIEAKGSMQNAQVYLESYKSSVDDLREVTNAYGARLRAQPTVFSAS